ncbi:disease resistance protein-like protein, partial [Tanacetum coccineum]
MWNSKENVEKLWREAEKLKNIKDRVEQKIKLALDNGDELVAGLQKWVDGKSFFKKKLVPKRRILDFYPRENINDLDTHKSLLEMITRSVLDENIQITGLYGIGGVGKTTLATEVAARVKDLFPLVVFVIVSKPVDETRIKTQ